MCVCVCGLGMVDLCESDGAFTWLHYSVICLSWRPSSSNFVCICVCSMGVGWGWRVVGVHEQHADEFPACADQITLPALSLFSPLRLSFSQSCRLPLLYSASLSAGKQPAISLSDAATVFEFLMTWEPCLVYRIDIRCTFICTFVRSTAA